MAHPSRIRCFLYINPHPGEIIHLVIDSNGLKVFWGRRKESQKARQRGASHLSVDGNTHEIVCADLSLNNVTDSEAFPGLLQQTHRKIMAAAVDGLTTPTLSR